MKFRWTMEQLDTYSDDRMLLALVRERMSDLNPYAPLAVRLDKIQQNLIDRIKEIEGKEAKA